MHYVRAGEGQPLVLLHGWPQTWFSWRHIIPRLALKFTVIAPDLRGLGDTAIPAHQGREVTYAKIKVASDIAGLMGQHLGFEKYYVAGHDWGGAVAFALACQQPEAVRRLAILDMVIPGDGREGGVDQGGKRWHHGFHRTPDLPELLTEGREKYYLDYFYNEYAEHEGAAIEPSARAEYVRCYASPERMSAGFAYYRATPRDVIDNRNWLTANGLLTMPVLGLAGGSGRGRSTEMADSLGRVARNVECHVLEGHGHLLPEEAPGPVTEHLLRFFVE